MRKSVHAIAASAALFVAGQAFAVDIGGLNVPLGPTFVVGQIYENVPTAVGDTLAGYGKVDSISSMAVSSLCTDCELTYQFGGYTVAAVSPTEIHFSGGWIKFYLGFGADNDFTTNNAGGSAGDLAEATNGTLFLTLKGHPVDAAGNTFIGKGTDIGTITPSGSGIGLADVDMSAGGIANPFFDSNSIVALFGGPADFEIDSSFSALHPVYPGECPGGPACLRGGASLTTTTVVPEPETYAMILAGLGVVGFMARRRKR